MGPLNLQAPELTVVRSFENILWSSQKDLLELGLYQLMLYCPYVPTEKIWGVCCSAVFPCSMEVQCPWLLGTVTDKKEDSKLFLYFCDQKCSSQPKGICAEKENLQE